MVFAMANSDQLFSATTITNSTNITITATNMNIVLLLLQYYNICGIEISCAVTKCSNWIQFLVSLCLNLSYYSVTLGDVLLPTWVDGH